MNKPNINLGHPNQDRGGRADSILTTISRSDYVIAVISPFQGKPTRLKVLKNRHDGKLGELDKIQACQLLIELIAQQAFSDTSGLSMYEEMLKGDITKCVSELLDKYNVKEEAIDYIRAKSSGHGLNA
jgi:hypothetical protein